MDRRIVIIGAGHAGGTVAAQLRQFGHAGPITLIGEEPAAPYQRPPLSKAWLKGEADLEALLLRPESFYAEHDITLRTGVRAETIDRARRTVALSDGGAEAYDVLILATGSQARKLSLPGADRPGLLELRTLADAERLKAALGPGKRLAVVGGGYIGLEAAASARALGAGAVVLERMPRVLARVASAPLSAFFEKYHRDRGVEIRTGIEVAGLEDGGVRLADGSRVEADAVLVGVGASACDDLAQAAGLACDDGLLVDEQARTSDPDIYAIGDMTRRPLPIYGGRRFRLESVPNALEQARQAAAAITGQTPPAPETPWFWSDQYDLKLQIAGLPFETDRLVVRGDPATARFAVFHLAAGRVMAVEAVNAPPEFMAGRQMIARAAVVDPERLADTTVSMKEIARG